MTDPDFNGRLEEVYRNHVPNFQRLISVERLSGGASQETYRILIETDAGEIPHAMRRAAGGGMTDEEAAAAQALGHPGLEVEAMLMQSAGAAGVPEPEVYYVLTPEDGLGRGFIMQWLDGEALGARILRGEQYAGLRPHLAYDCGRTLAKIHSIDLDSTGLRKKLVEVPPEAFVHQMWDRYKNYETPQPMIDYAARWLLDHLPTDYQPALVHNDFRNGNFMVSETEIVAVLDWEVAHIGDPMRDLGWICTNSWRFGGAGPVGGFGQYEDLFRGYEEVSGRTVNPDTVRFWEVFGSYWWAVGCLGMAEHYRHGPDQTVERPAIGRRTSECQVDCVNLLIPGPVELLKPDETGGNLDMPSVDELLVSVRDFLRDDVMGSTRGRTNFLSRVASNSLDIVLREWHLGASAKQHERDRLRQFYGSDEKLETLRWRLVNALRDGSQALDDNVLQDHLRHTVVNQIAIDQPKYSGFRTAVGSN